MSSTAIKIENLSKRYRIGLREEMPDSLTGALLSWGMRPLANFRRLRSLSEFAENEESEDVIWALKDVSFQVRRGEVLAIVGRNGAGKSTLLKILSRITWPTRGEVELYGRVSSLLEVGTGFHMELTGRENIYLNGSVLGMKKGDIDGKFDDIVAFSGVERFIDTPVKRYSSGMIVRLAFSVAAHLEPEILIIDEVLAVGDADFQRKCIGKMESVAQREGRTVLLVSHNMATVRSLADRAVFLDRGVSSGVLPVEDAVARYSNRSIASREAVFRKDHMKTDGEAVIHRVRVLNQNGEESTRIPTCEGFSIEIKWENRVGCNVNPHVRFVRHDGVKALVASDVPLDLDGSQKREKGIYLSRAGVPANTLNAGEFTLDVELWCAAPQRRLEAELALLTFVIWDPMDDRCLSRGKFAYPVYAVVFPALKWEWEKVDT